MAKVTVLMAVYNAERWLERSIRSLLTQTMTDWQLICIDDASTDGSLDILRRFQQEDQRIELISLSENRGQAHARNCGLKQAKGDYICFLDADDWLSADALQQAVGMFEMYDKTDCVLFRVVHVEQDVEHDYPMSSFSVLTGEEAFDRSLEWQIHGVYMVRASLHQHFPYDETCSSYSDDNTTRLHYYHSREVRCCQGVYYYFSNSASATHQVSVRRFDYLKANESMKRQLLELGIALPVVARYEQVRWLVLIDCYMFYHVHASELATDERRYGLSELRRIWSTIDRNLLNKETTTKFGYRPCKFWWVFRLQEWCYFTLRGFLGKNR